MKIFGLVLLFIGSSAFASTNGYELKMDLSKNGKKLSSPSMTLKAGETATITQKTDSGMSFIDVVATENKVKNRKGILMEFNIGYIGKNGAKTMRSQQKIVIPENTPQQIVIDGKDEGQMTLSLVAQRRLL